MYILAAHHIYLTQTVDVSFGLDVTNLLRKYDKEAETLDITSVCS